MQNGKIRLHAVNCFSVMHAGRIAAGEHRSRYRHHWGNEIEVIQ